MRRMAAIWATGDRATSHAANNVANKDDGQRRSALANVRPKKTDKGFVYYSITVNTDSANNVSTMTSAPRTRNDRSMAKRKAANNRFAGRSRAHY